ncbi:hypothetical protein NL676_004864 [Syzygium grande]|nr:hypothetical protein NL676_004864 [Syzygium grande]
MAPTALAPPATVAVPAKKSRRLLVPFRAFPSPSLSLCISTEEILLSRKAFRIPSAHRRTQLGSLRWVANFFRVESSLSRARVTELTESRSRTPRTGTRDDRIGADFFLFKVHVGLCSFGPRNSDKEI